MELVKSIKDILENAKRFDNYLECGNSNEKEFAINCIGWGRCFVVVKENDNYKFYPSKYIGIKIIVHQDITMLITVQKHYPAKKNTEMLHIIPLMEECRIRQ